MAQNLQCFPRAMSFTGMGVIVMEKALLGSVVLKLSFSKYWRKGRHLRDSCLKLSFEMNKEVNRS